MGKLKTGVKGVTIQDGKFVVSKQYKGTKIFKRFGNSSPETLEEVKTFITEQMYLIDNPEPDDEFPDSSSLTIQEALEYLWKHHLQYKDYAIQIKHQLTRLNERLGDKIALKLKKSDIETYKRERLRDTNRNKGQQHKPISKRTLQCELKYLSQAFNLLVADGVIERNHIKGFINIKLNRNDPIIFDDGYEYGNEYHQILLHISPKTRPLFELLYETGLRPKELFNLRWHWIQQKTENCWIILVPSSELLTSKKNFREKTGNGHMVPLSPRALEVLQGIGIKEDSTALVFPSPVTGLPRRDIRTSLETAINKAGLQDKEITPYALRRTRLTIGDEIDSNAARYAGGHVARDVHERNYVKMSLRRLFKLVKLDFDAEFTAKMESCKTPPAIFPLKSA